MITTGGNSAQALAFEAFDGRRRILIGSVTMPQAAVTSQTE
jgi:hypothetical protein